LPTSCRYHSPIGWVQSSSPSFQRRTSRAGGIFATCARSIPRICSRRVALPPIATPAPISRSSVSCSKICTDIDCCNRPAASVRPPMPPPTIATSHLRVISAAHLDIAPGTRPVGPEPGGMPATGSPALGYPSSGAQTSGKRPPGAAVPHLIEALPATPDTPHRTLSRGSTTPAVRDVDAG
jgi:hypothetical protein